MPMPNDGETRQDFIDRCVPMILNEGTADDNDQAVAICNSMWEDRKEKQMEYSKPLEITEFKAAGDDWVVEGYVSTFSNVDEGRDMVMPGAFQKTLKGGPKVRFLMSHDPALVLGVPRQLKEDKKGLFGAFKISKTQLGGDVRQLLLDGALDSFSIGYIPVEWKIVSEDIRQLDEIKLYEASLVSLPMNPEATVTRVKYMSLVDRTAHLKHELSELLNDFRGPASHADRPLSETKRNEIEALLTLCAGFDDVRNALKDVLNPTWHGSELTMRKLASAKRRLANIIQE